MLEIDAPSGTLRPLMYRQYDSLRGNRSNVWIYEYISTQQIVFGMKTWTKGMAVGDYPTYILEKKDIANLHSGSNYFKVAFATIISYLYIFCYIMFQIYRKLLSLVRSRCIHLRTILQEIIKISIIAIRLKPFHLII